jgi:ankyrin repeat protein
MIMSSNLASEIQNRRGAALNAYESPRDYDPTNKGEETSPGIAHSAMLRADGCVTQDNARAHYGHTYVQNQYNSYSENYQQQPGPSSQRVDFVKALEFGHIDDRYYGIHAAYTNTCRWLFQKLEYIRWRDPEYLDSHHGFLWIKGKAGSGKSTLMKYAFENALESLQDDKVFSFFFYARGQYLDKSVEGMYRSLLLQLLRSFPELRDKLPKYSSGSVQQRGWAISALRDHFGKIINSLGRDKSVTIYIDALDECDEDEIRDAIEHFEELSTSAISKRIRLYICFASRYYPQITMRRFVELSVESQSEHLQDIRTYIHNNLAIRDVESRLELATQIEARSNGVFLWVVLVVRSLKRKVDLGATRSQLLHTLNEVPEKLRDVIAAILHSPDEALICAMRWILFARRPLVLEELYFAIQTGTGQISSGVWNPIEITRDGMRAFILRYSRGLIEVEIGTRVIRRVKKRIARVQLIHESVREHLLAGGLAALGPCSNETVAAESHVKLFRWCQLYFSFDDRKHPLLSDREELHDPSDYDDLEAYPLLEYAASSVWEHLEICYTAGALDWSSIRDFPLKLWLHSHTASRYGFDREDLLWLDSHLHLPYSLLYILINRGCGKLAGAVLAANLALWSPWDGQHSTSTETLADDSPFISLLELAVSTCSDVVQTLLEHGADINVDEDAPLLMAVQCESIDRRNKNVVELLLENGACAQATHKPSNTTVLALAARHCHAGSVMSLLKHRADVNGADDRSIVSPLLAALGHEAQDKSLDHPEYSRELDFSARQRDVTCTLLEGGANINLKAGALSLSPLQFAVQHWGRHVVELLLHGDLQATNEAGNVLVYAAKRLNVEVIEYLLERGVDARAKQQALEAVLLTKDLDLSRWTEKHHGLHARQARSNITLMLLDAGADMHKIDGDYETALIAASARGHIEVVRLLTAQGADLGHRSRRYGTAMEVARLECQWEVYEVLLRFRWAVFEESSAKDEGTSERQ